MLIHEMPMDAYREWDAISASDLKNFARSAAYAKLRPAISSESLEWGTAVHTAVLEPHELDRRYGIDPESPKGGYPAGWRNTKDYKEQRAAALERPGVVGLLTSQQRQDLYRIADNVAQNDIGKKLHELRGHRESSLFFGGCKVRPDWLIPDARMIVDVKTARDWRPGSFARACAQYQYHVSDAFYRDTFNAWDEAGGEIEIDHYVYLVIAADAPYEVASYTLDHDSVEQGRAVYQRLLAGYRSCKESGIWPGGSDKIQEIRLPEYAIDYYKEGEGEGW